MANFDNAASRSAGLTWMALQNRGNEMRRLRDAYERSLDGTISGAFIHGSPGCGKSLLLDAFQKSLGSKAFVCRGKFDNNNTSAAEPLVSIISIFDQLVHNLEVSDESSLWRARLRNVLDKDFRKAYEDIIAAFGRLMSNNRRRSSFAMLDIDFDSDGYITNERDWGFERFRLACRAIMRVICRQHPVVIILDDLHWAERDSLEIIRTLIQDSQPGLQLFVVATFCTVPDHHELWKLRKSLPSLQVTNIEMSAFRKKDLSQLVAGLVGGKETPEALSLVDFVYRVTKGNALLITQLVRYLQSKDMLIYDTRQERFTWKVDTLQIDELIDPRTALQVQLDGLDESQKLVVVTVALLGSTTFDVGILQRVVVPSEDVETEDQCPNHCLISLIGLTEQQRTKELVTILHALSEKGLVIAPSEDFNHYRIHDLTLEVVIEHLIQDKRKKQELHLILGRRLNFSMELSKETGIFLEETLLFNCVHQMNLASDLIQDRWELVDLVNKNYDASEVAALKYSYFSGLKYCCKGIALLGYSWEANYGLMLKLSNAQSRMHLYCGNISESLRVADQVIAHAQNFDDKRLAYRTKLMCFMESDDQKSALELNLQILEELGHTFPKKALKSQASRLSARVRRLLHNKSDQDLAALRPEIAMEKADQKWTEICDFMVALGDISGHRRNNYHIQLSMVRLLQISIARAWRLPATALTFVYSGYMLAQAGKYEEAVRIGRLGLRYAVDPQGPGSGRSDLRARILFHKCIDHWARPLQECFDGLSAAVGDLQKIGASELILPDVATTPLMAFLASRSLCHVEHCVKEVSEMCQDYQQHFHNFTQYAPFFQMISNLRRSNETPSALDGTYMQGESALAQWKASRNHEALQMYYLCGATLGLFFYDLVQANEMCKSMSAESEFEPDFLLPFRVFIKGTVGFLLARTNRAKKHGRQGQAALKRFNQWVQNGRANCMHFQMILYALRLAQKGNSNLIDIRNAFDNAIDQCARGGFVQFQALTCELAGRFLLERKAEALAKRYFSQARTWYREWECDSKVDYLRFASPTDVECRSELWAQESGGTSPSSSLGLVLLGDTTSTRSLFPRIGSCRI
ncbi:hypothetical protein ACA910_006967 [Epithemia clementina (nom. ined.)]